MTEDSSKLSEESTILESKVIALGLSQKTLGLKTAN